MRHTSGTSLVEVMVMMVILGVSLVGIFSMVDSGQKLASITDARLVAVNIAREGLESVTTLRDTFSLANFPSGSCTVGAATVGAFFTTDGSQILDVNCPFVATTTGPRPENYTPYYALYDDKILTKKISTDSPSVTKVCMNEIGWYSQEFSDKNGQTLSACRSPGTGCTTCSATLASCANNTTQKCVTRYQRKITFSQCDPQGSQYCIVAKSTVWWGDTEDKTISLSQLITVK